VSYNVCVEDTAELCTIPQRSSTESANAFLARLLTRAARRPHSESDEQRTDAMTARAIHGDAGGVRQGQYVQQRRHDLEDVMVAVTEILCLRQAPS